MPLGTVPVHVTDDSVAVARPVLEAMLAYAADREPASVSVALDRDAAGDLVPAEGAGEPLDALDPDAPVFAAFSLPDAGGAVNRVFGVDLGRPAGTARGRFVSHPNGDRELATTDDLASRVLVAVPPWIPSNVRAYDRHGSRLSLRLVAARLPDDGVV